MSHKKGMLPFGIDAQRQTEDLDFAIALAGWDAFEALRERLTGQGAFQPSGNTHRLKHSSGFPIDLVPFGAVETVERKIAWPPRGEVVMDVFGFREALAAAGEAAFPGDIRAKVVSLPALALLKIVCWRGRHYESPRKDAHDLILILRNYLGAGNEQRLWDEFSDWTETDDFDYEIAGARMLGFDIRGLLDPVGVDRISGVLAEQVDAGAPGLLANEMSPHDPDRARALLVAVLKGLTENERG